MSFKHLEIKESYDSDEDDILNEFYVKILSHATQYDRIAGYFSSSVLAVAAQGMQKFIQNGGKMRLITSARFSEKDYVAIQRGLKSKEQAIADQFIDDLNSIKDNFVKDHVRALAWMIARGKLEIKIAIIDPDSDKPPAKTMFHQKVGILVDANGNRLSFSGSENETFQGWRGNVEEFKVFRDWVPGDKVKFESDVHKFNKFWDGLAKRVQIINLPTAVKAQLIKLAPASTDELMLEKWIPSNSGIEPSSQELRYYQSDAILSWEKANKSGILSIATGCGKTRIGLAILAKVLANEVGYAVISAPTEEICKQWRNQIIKKPIIDGVTLAADQILLCSGSSGWKNEISDIVHNFNKSRTQRLIFVVTTSSLMQLLEYLKKIERTEPVKSLIIGDEVHSLGAEQMKNLLVSLKSSAETFQYKLGLSATPERLFDTAGTDAIMSYFGGIIFEYSLKQAIEEKFLAPYNYHVRVIELTHQELADYRELTRKYVTLTSVKSKNKPANINSLEEKYLFDRARILKKAVNKYAQFRETITSMGNYGGLGYTLVFCADNEQLTNLAKMLQELKITEFSQITQDEYSEQRDEITADFETGIIKLILSISVLNEGVDLKKARNAIILASSTNSREFIQRSGRILRLEPGYEKVANIFDMFVIPSTDLITALPFEKSLVLKELKRIKYFAQCASNYREILNNKRLKAIADACEYSLSQ